MFKMAAILILFIILFKSGNGGGGGGGCKSHCIIFCLHTAFCIVYLQLLRVEDDDFRIYFS